jgi:hypothetical protein
MWVGIGCGGLFLLSAVGGVIAFVMAKRAADTVLAQAGALAGGGSTGTGDSSGTGTGTGTSTGTDSNGGPAGGACAKAAECCRKFVHKSNAGAQAEQGCLMLKQLPEANCTQPLATYQQSAKLLGVSCD